MPDRNFLLTAHIENEHTGFLSESGYQYVLLLLHEYRASSGSLELTAENLWITVEEVTSQLDLLSQFILEPSAENAERLQMDSIAEVARQRLRRKRAVETGMQYIERSLEDLGLKTVPDVLSAIFHIKANARDKRRIFAEKDESVEKGVQLFVTEYLKLLRSPISIGSLKMTILIDFLDAILPLKIDREDSDSLARVMLFHLYMAARRTQDEDRSEET